MRVDRGVNIRVHAAVQYFFARFDNGAELAERNFFDARNILHLCFDRIRIKDRVGFRQFYDIGYILRRRLAVDGHYDAQPANHSHIRNRPHIAVLADHHYPALMARGVIKRAAQTAHIMIILVICHGDINAAPFFKKRRQTAIQLDAGFQHVFYIGYGSYIVVYVFSHFFAPQFKNINRFIPKESASAIMAVPVHIARLRLIRSATFAKPPTARRSILLNLKLFRAADFTER